MGVTDVERATAFWCDALQCVPRVHLDLYADGQAAEVTGGRGQPSRRATSVAQ
jgi:hypothetical protein